MININTNIEATLKEVIPTYYENYLDSDYEIPCVVYSILQNSEVEKGNVNGYSLITVRVKLWAVSIKDLCDYSEAIDNALAELGHFERQSVGELVDGDLMCRIMDYSILLPEQYNSYRI